MGRFFAINSSMGGISDERRIRLMNGVKTA
jgi:hypothetical protein